jgi:hypothetical protein
MAIDPLAERISQVLAVPHELLDYQRWLDERRRAPSSARDYLFARTEPRFEPRRDDRVVALPSLALVERGGVVCLCAREAGVELELRGVTRRDAERVLGAVDGKRCLLEVRWSSGVEPAVLGSMLRAAFGRVLLAPHAVEALEARLPSLEITRFPASPYGVERPYWENMIAVRERFDAQREALAPPESFVRLLRELHVLALMGSSLQSFYKPQSPVSDYTVAPGALFHDAPQLLRTASGVVFLAGPRVNAKLLGGLGYHQALARSLGDPGALDAERELELDGIGWGGVTTARSERDEQAGPWFCPPRPMTAEHFELLQGALGAACAAAAQGDRPTTTRALGRFHYAFVRLHPFHCANQSLAMNLVNAVLRSVQGAGIPHLVLDHLALRLKPDAYQQVFARAVAAYSVVDSNPAGRLATLQSQVQRYFTLLERLAACSSDEAIEARCTQAPDAARAALLRD